MTRQAFLKVYSLAGKPEVEAVSDEQPLVGNIQVQLEITRPRIDGVAQGMFAQRGQVLGARDLGAGEALDFLAVLAQLLHHLVEVAPQFADVVLAVGEGDGDGELAVARVHAPGACAANRVA